MLDIHFSDFPTLRTARLLLRQIEPGDAEALFGLRSDERVLRYLARAPQQDIGEAAQMIERIRNAFAQNEGLSWTISLHGQARMIGDICFWKIDKPNHRAEIGYLLHPDYWRQGIMDEAMTAVLEYGFRTLNFHSVEANTDPANEASGRLLERHGFAQEALFRENMHFEGRFLDSRIYSKINPYH